MKTPPKVHRIPVKRAPPTSVPDSKRNIRDTGGNPGGLPPRSFEPGWRPPYQPMHH
jgi:hypothetical protein